MRVAALDLGSNTTLMLIADVEDGRVTRVVRDLTTVTRMGQGVHASRRFHPEALSRVDRALAEYARLIAGDACDHVVAVATSAARDVSNADELIARGRDRGIPIEIISGEREAELTFRGAPAAAGASVVDVGGGSTEIIGARDGRVRGVSVDVGSVRLSEAFVTGHPVAASELGNVGEHVRRAFAAADLPAAGPGPVIAVAGTPTTLATLDAGRDFDEAFVHGYVLTKARIDAWTKRLAAMSVAERERLPGMAPKRADVIVVGGLILSAALEALGRDRVTVSTRGVRYGVAVAWDEFRRA